MRCGWWRRGVLRYGASRCFRGLRGRTWACAVVPSRARSYLREALTPDRACSGTTAPPRVRPREVRGDARRAPQSGGGSSGSNRQVQRETGDGHDRAPQSGRSAEYPDRHHGASATAASSDSSRHAGLVRTCSTRDPGGRARRRRTDFGAELNRSRAGTRPISARHAHSARHARPARRARSAQRGHGLAPDQRGGHSLRGGTFAVDRLADHLDGARGLARRMLGDDREPRKQEVEDLEVVVADD